MNERTVVVPAALAGERLDRAVALLAATTRAEAALVVDHGGAAINGLPVTRRSHRLKEGDELEVRLEELAPRPKALAVPPDRTVVFSVVHDDEDVIVVDKPAGVVTHPGAGNLDATLAGGLASRYPELTELPAAGYGSPERPGIVHRLDKETSGLLAVARSPRGYRSLTAQLAERRMGRTYLALVAGEVRAPEGLVDAPIGRSGRDPTKMTVSAEGRTARTRYHVLERFSGPVTATLLELSLETGRTHQIRVHVAAIGHPVLGDRRYGGMRGASGVNRLMLHAAQLAFEHPSDGRVVRFRSPPPDDFRADLGRFG